MHNDMSHVEMGGNNRTHVKDQRSEHSLAPARVYSGDAPPPSQHNTAH